MLCNQELIDKFNLTTYDFLDILQEDSIEGFRFRKSSGRLLLASQRLILIWDSRECCVSYDNILSRRFKDFINTAEAWVSNGLLPCNWFVIRAALHLIYEDIQEQVQKLKRDVEGSWNTSRAALADLGRKEILVSSKSKKIMDDIFNPGFEDRLMVVTYLGPRELQECKKPWESIDGQLDGIRALLDSKLRHCSARLVWFAVFFAVVISVVNVITVIQLAAHEEGSSFSVFTFLLGVVGVFLLFFSFQQCSK